MKMVSRLRLSREISITLHLHFRRPGILNKHSRQSLFAAAPLVTTFPESWVKIGESTVNKWFHVQRFSAVCEAPENIPGEVDLLTFFESSLDELEGPCHYWLNRIEQKKEPFKRDGLFLVLSGAFLDNSLNLESDHVLMLEGVKLLQRRYPQLNVFGFQADSSVNSVASRTCLVQNIMKEYITFPVLLSNKIFSETKKGTHYLLFKDFKCPLMYYDKTTDIGTVCKAIDLIENEKSGMIQNSITALKHVDVIKEPYLCSFRNLLLCFPGSISVDEDGNRLFLSDSNHHRIIIFDGRGKIQDSIGSSPGFEDGEFESSKLLRPAASFYHADEDCLFFVDSENHAVRRADMRQRSVETIYPPCHIDSKFDSIRNWILDKLGVKRKVAPKLEELSVESLRFPWHLMKSSENNLLIVNRSFDTLWVMESTSGKIEEVVRGYGKIMEACGQIITEKLSLFNQIYGDQLELGSYPSSEEKHPDLSLLSSVVAFQDDIMYCETVGQAVLRQNRESGVVSSLQLSNFGVLGLPYWFSSSPEKVFIHGYAHPKLHLDHFQCFSVLPGRCGIQVNIDIPMDTELLAPLQEGCIWRQARGSAVDVSGLDDTDSSTEKVGVAQQWYDDLDNLAFTPEPELSAGDENENLERNTQDDKRVHIKCVVNASPGTSEIIIYGVLYLKLNSACSSHGKENLRRILDIVNDDSGRHGKDSFIELMSESKQDVRDVIFMKPLHMIVGLDCQDHPKPTKANEVVLTDSNVEVNVSLK